MKITIFIIACIFLSLNCAAANNMFDFGIATKGPLSLTGNIELTGENITVDSQVFTQMSFEIDTSGWALGEHQVNVTLYSSSAIYRNMCPNPL